MKRKTIQWLFVGVCLLFVVSGGVVCPLMCNIGVHHAIKLALALGEASTVLFGVFGVWLGICYRDDIETMTAGKKGDELRQAAEEVSDRAERCAILFRGLWITFSIFVASILVRSFDSVIVIVCQKNWIAEIVFCVTVFSSVVLLVFGILSPVVIMLHAMVKIHRAADSANETLRLTGRSSNK